METAMIVRSMDDAERAARAMAASGFFNDTKQAQQAIVKVLAGHELGFGPFASMTGVHIIQGKPTLAANLMAAAVKRNGKYNYRVIEASDTNCVLEWYEGGQIVGRSSFSWEEASRAGLNGKDNWKKYPSDMLFARALSRGQRRYAPDIFNGATVYTPDEMGASVDEEGRVIEAVAHDLPAPENISQETGQETKPVELIDPMGEWAVGYAAQHWNVSKADAAKNISSRGFGKRIDKAEFIAAISPDPQEA